MRRQSYVVYTKSFELVCNLSPFFVRFCRGGVGLGERKPLAVCPCMSEFNEVSAFFMANTSTLAPLPAPGVSGAPRYQLHGQCLLESWCLQRACEDR